MSDMARILAETVEEKRRELQEAQEALREELERPPEYDPQLAARRDNEFRFTRLAKDRMLNGTLNSFGPFGLQFITAPSFPSGFVATLGVIDRDGKLLAEIGPVNMLPGDTFTIIDVMSAFQIRVA